MKDRKLVGEQVGDTKGLNLVSVTKFQATPRTMLERWFSDLAHGLESMQMTC